MKNLFCRVLQTECLLHFRKSTAWLYPLGFFIIITCLFPLAFTPDADFLEKYLGGCVWIAALLASVLSVENLLQADMEEGYMEQVLLSEAPLPLILAAKLTAQWLMSQLPLILLTPLLCLIFHLSFTTTLALCASLGVGTPILTCVGGMSVALTLGLRQQGMLLGLLMLPLVVPVLIFGVNIASATQAGFSARGPIAFLAGLAVMAALLLPFAMAAVIRVWIEE